MLTLLQGDAITMLRTLPAESVQCCVTSPPYWGLRDYGTGAWEGGEEGCDHRKEHSMATSGLEGGKTTTLHNHYHREQCPCGAKRIDSQLGLEPTPEEYVTALVNVMAEVKRVLRHDGTLWLNLGDSYASGGRGGGANGSKQQTNEGSLLGPKDPPPGLKPKDLVGIPWRVAFALQAAGWYLRSDIIWSKPNPMPESVTDRPTKAHEYIFLLSKSGTYFYDSEAIKERSTHAGKIVTLGEKSLSRGQANGAGVDPSGNGCACEVIVTENRNKRSVWTVATQPYTDAHFATFPSEIPKLCILAGTSAKGACANCGAPWQRIVQKPIPPPQAFDKAKYDQIPDCIRNDGMKRTSPTKDGRASGQKLQNWLNENPTTTLGWQPTCPSTCSGRSHCNSPTTPCTVLDPFAGSGTTGQVAIELGRRATLIELNPHYVQLIEQRCTTTIGLPLA